jgi:Tol biopolymer transport system component
MEMELASQDGKERRLWWVAGLVAVGLALAATIAWLGRPEPPKPIRSTIWTSLEGYELDPAFSPDGNQLAFVWDGGGDGFFHLYVKLVSGGDMLQLTDSPSNHRFPSWSPDGQEIAFVRRTESGYEVRAVPALGGAERRLAASTAIPDGLDWSPDGRFIAMTDRIEDNETEHIALLETATGRKTVLMTPSRTHRDGKPAFSPDGATLGFVRKKLGGGIGQILLKPVDGGEARHLPLDVDWPEWLDWLPDGSALLAVGVQEGDTTLWRVPVNGRPATRVGLGDDPKGFAIDPTGTRLAYEKRAGPNADIWRVSGPKAEVRSEPTRLIASTRLDWDPEYSPDGNKIAFVSMRSGGNAVWVCDQNGTNASRLIPDSITSSPTWSPDGKRIAYTGRRDGQNEVYIADAAGGWKRRLTQNPTNDGAPVFSKDGRWILFTSDRGGESRVWKIPVDGGDAIPVTPLGGRVGRETDDGRYLIYTKQAHRYLIADLYRIPIDGGEEELILERQTAGFNWLLWEGDLIFVGPLLQKGTAIQRLDLETLEVTTLVELGDEFTFSNGLDVSPDGRWVLFTVQLPQTTDLILVENFQ